VEGFEALAVAAHTVLEEVGRCRMWGVPGFRWESEPYRPPRGRTCCWSYGVSGVAMSYSLSGTDAQMKVRVGSLTSIASPLRRPHLRVCEYVDVDCPIGNALRLE
jgi:hypothetical protein